MVKKEELEECDSIQIEINNLIDEYDEISGKYFKNINEYIDIQRVEFKGCYFENVKLQESRMISTDFTNCVFKNVDLSGCNFSESIFSNVMFENCKLDFKIWIKKKKKMAPETLSSSS